MAKKFAQRYVISDLHLGHGNIIGYTGRPFDDVHDMDTSLISNWNDTVSEEDSVIYLGDLTASGDTADRYLEQLNGNILVIQGNHDSDLSGNAPVNVVESCTINHGRFKFFLEHRPVDAPGWQIHGHTHNNGLTDYPFISQQRQRVNVSCEVIGYEPLLLDDLVWLLDKKSRYTMIDEAPSK